MVSAPEDPTRPAPGDPVDGDPVDGDPVDGDPVEDDEVDAGPADHADAPASPPARRRRWAVVLGVGVVLAVVSAALGSTTSRYVEPLAGPALPVEVVGAPGRPGAWRLPTVELRPVTWAGWWGAVLGGRELLDAGGVPRPARPPGEASELRRSQRSAWQAATSLLAAAGVAVDPDGPPPVQLAAVDGPSGGLVFALAYLEATGGGSLAAGRTVAATGTIDADGSVGPVGFVDEKLAGAAGDDVAVFLVPAREAAAAPRPAGVELVAVEDLAGAVAWLCATGGSGPVCPRG